MEWLLNLDGQILIWIQEYIRQDWLTPAMKWITTLGDKGLFWIELSLLLLLFKKTRKAGVLALCTMAFGFLMTNVCIKNLVARPRPYTQIQGLVPLIAHPSDWSFPSGHTTVSFAAALGYYRMLPKKWGLAAVVLACAIAFSRLYLGVHYPTDVIGGFLVAFVGNLVLSKLLYGKVRK